VYITEVFKDVVEKHGVSLGDIPSLKVVVRDTNYYEQLGDILAEFITADSKILGNISTQLLLF